MPSGIGADRVGVNLSPIVTAKEIKLEDLRGKTVAVDAYNTIFQFLSIIRQPDGKPLMDAEGRVTSHLSGILYRTANLIEAGIEPSFVFDGKPNELKAGPSKKGSPEGRRPSANMRRRWRKGT